eukprot:CCRYP_003298-RA/>CCRYP_003298-RA protein AED:0.45 eAED:0.36 QI:0/0/0/1/0/0/2/0/113
MQMHTTKDKKQNPVVHATASIGTGMICILKLEVIGMRLANMLKSVCLFIGRGYLAIAKAQNHQVANLIQIMEKMNVKFLGTVKNNNAFPFQFVEVNMNGKQIVNGKLWPKHMA